MSKKTWIGLGVVGFWALMTVLLLQREWGGTPVSQTGESTGRQINQAESTWLGLFLADGPQVGHIHLRRLPEQRQGLPGVRFTMNTQMALNLMGRDTDLRVVGAMWRAHEQPLAELDLTVESMEQTLRLTGEVRDGELNAEVRSGGESMPLQLPMDPEVLLQTGLGTASSFPAMEVGDDFRMESFDPLTMRQTTARVRCVEEAILEVDGVGVETRKLEVTTGGFTSTAWVDTQGEVVRAETPFGLVLQRLSPERASAMAGQSTSGTDLLGLTAIRPKGPKPYRGATEIRLRLSGLERGTEIPTGDHQILEADGTLRITQEASVSSSPPDSEQLEAMLAEDAFVQSGHPSILEQARKIVGDESDPAAKARRIHNWVFTRLDKVPVMSIPSALEVLESRQGDCNEHTVLFTALARASGLPTRIAIGLVWSDELDGFYYHAWPEVWLGDRFQRFDPTLDQPSADATHIKLLEGGIESWPKLLAFLGRMDIEVIDLQGSNAQGPGLTGPQDPQGPTS